MTASAFETSVACADGRKSRHQAAFWAGIVLLAALLPALAFGQRRATPRRNPPTRPVPPAAEEALKAVRDPRKLAELARGLAGEPDPDVRAAIVIALSSQPDEERRPALVEALADPSADVRAAAVGGLGRLGTDAAFDGIERRLLNDPNAGVKMAACFWLGRSRQERRVDALGVGLIDPDPNVRLEAAEALGFIGGGRAQDLLRGAVDDPDPRVRESARRHLP